jgi:hypothetical protein
MATSYAEEYRKARLIQEAFIEGFEDTGGDG